MIKEVCQHPKLFLSITTSYPHHSVCSLTSQLLEKFKWEVFHQPPYILSSADWFDLAQTNFFTVPQIEG